jgi:phosphatidylglycerol:prolipoprotein diacylglycerol transferase
MVHAAQQNEGLIGIGDMALPVHPTQLYEAGAEIVMFWVLVMLRPHKRFHGQLFLTWLAIYPIIRTVIEVFRGDKERGIWLWGLSTSQWLSLVVAGFAIWLGVYLWRSRQPRAAGATSGAAA